MPIPFFVIPIPDPAMAAWNDAEQNDPVLAAGKAELQRRPDLGEVDAASQTLKIYVEFKDFRSKFMGQTKLLSGNLRADLAAQPPYATPEYLQRSARLLDEARDAFRGPGFAYPQADKSTATGITPQMSQSQGLQQVMNGNNNAGMCLATSHTDLVSKKLLFDALDNGDFFGNGPGLLFIEELPSVLQQDLNAYLAAPNTPMSRALKAKLDELDAELAKKNPDYDQHPTSNWNSVLAKAQEKGVKVYGIDGGDADPGVEASSAGFAERRVVKMNKLAADVMRQARQDHPGLKFVASMGGAHANTHEGGIPGLAQVFDVPVLKADAANQGRLVALPDDTTKRRMPPKEQQAFMDAYIEAVEAAAPNLNPAVTAAFRAKIYANAAALATKLAGAGALAAGTDIRKLMAAPAVTTQSKGLSDLMKAWPVPPNAPADPTKLARLAATADMPAELDQLARNHPQVLTDTDDDQQTVLHWAARMGRPDCITTASLRGGDVNAVDGKGLSPIHLAVERRRERDDPRAQDQAAAVHALLNATCYADMQDGDGKTAAHYAALNNNTWSLDTLHQGGAHLDIRDNRGWKPVDVAVGSTKVESEKFFYDQNIEPNPALLANSDVSIDTIGALMRATRCEKPADIAQVREAYEKLYAIKELRPLLELLALDALAPRDPENGGGLRICVADADNVGKLYAAVDSTPPGGAYDEGAHVLMVGSNVADDFAGTLIHEMTHAAARVVYGEQVLPFDATGEADYRKAIATDVRSTALLMPGKGALENDVMDRMSGRMDHYVQKYAATAQKTVNQEFIVGVPQLMAQYGPDEVRKLAPGMTAFFQGGFMQAVKAKRADPKYATALTKIDDTALANLAAPPKAEGTRLENDTSGVDDALSLIRKGYVAQYGTLPADGVLYQASQIKLSDQDQNDFNARMERVEKVMRKVFIEQGLPPDMSADSMRALAIELGATIRNTARPKDLDDIVAARATTWTRDVKIQHVEYWAEKDPARVSDRAMAEAIVIRAENLVWMEGATANGGDHLAVEVDAKKHRELVLALERDLSNTSEAIKADPEALMKRLSASLAGDRSKGFYRKGEKRIGTRDPDHVSIDVDHAKRTWINELRAMLARG